MVFDISFGPVLYVLAAIGPGIALTSLASREAPHAADSLEKYAALLRLTGREIEAVKLEARAKAIRAKHA